MKKSIKLYELDIRNNILTNIFDRPHITSSIKSEFSTSYAPPHSNYRFETYDNRGRGWWLIYDNKSRIGAYNKAVNRLYVLKNSFNGRLLARTFYSSVPTVTILDADLPKLENLEVI